MRRALRTAVFGIVLMVVLVMAATPPAAAVPKVIWGYMYDSDGDSVTQNTTIEVVVVSDGTETRYAGTIDANSGTWQAEVLDDWMQGDTYYVIVDGTPWGDVNARAHDADTPARTEWTMNSAAAEQLNLQTVKEVAVVVEEQNLKPMISAVFLLVLFLTSVLLLGLLNRQKVDVAITGKKKVTVRRGDTAESHFSYTCSYGTPEELTELGEIDESQLDVRDGTLQRVAVSRILRAPDGSYTWHNAKLVESSGVKKVLASEAIVHEKWFQGGGLQVAKGQTPKSAVLRRKAWMWGALGLPFIVLELAFLLGSATTGAFAVPPWLGAGMILNLLILAVGIVVQALAWRHVRKPTDGEKAAEAGPSAQQDASAEPEEEAGPE